MHLPVYLNGRWHDEPIGLPLDDPGVVQGVTLVETLRTYGRVPFEPSRHWERLHRGLAYLGLDRFPDEHSPDDLVAELLDRLPGADDVAIVILVTPGRERPTVVCHARPLPPYEAWRRDGVALAIPTVTQGAELPRTFKHRSRLHWWKAAREADVIAVGSHAWLRDADGPLTETASGNVVAVCAETLVEMPPDRVVPGVTAAIVRELAASVGLSHRTQEFGPGDLAGVDELWMTSTGCGVVPVRSVADAAATRFEMTTRSTYDRIAAAWDERLGFRVPGVSRGSTSKTPAN